MMATDKRTKSPGISVDMRTGERLSISGPATLEVVHKSGHFSRLRVVADKSVEIRRIAVSSGPTVLAPSMADCLPS